MKQKKLSLGEILRKINEEERTSDAPSPEKPAATPSAGKDGPVAAAEARDSENIPVRDPEPPQNRPGSLYARQEPVAANDSDKQQVDPPARKNGPALEPEPRPEKQILETSGGRSAASRNYPTHNGPAPHMPFAGRAEPQINKEEDDVAAEFDLYKYFGIIAHRKNIVLITVAVVTLLSVFQYLKSDKNYLTHARLLFKPAEKELTGEQVSSSLVSRDKLFNTHIELLRSNAVLTLVADNLGNRVRQNQIRRDLTITQGITNKDKNDIIELGYKNPDPELARDVINELCKTYIDYRLEVNAQEVTRLLYKFDIQISKLQEELNRKEGDLRRFKESNRMVELSSEANLTSTKLSSMEVALQETQLALIESKDKLTSLTSQIGKQDLTIVQSMTYSDPIKEKLSALELEYNSLSAENSPEHPKVRMIRQQIEKLKAAAVDSISQEAASKTLIKNPLRESLLSDYVNLTIEQSALEAKRIALEKVIEDLNLDLLKLPAIEQKYAFLQRETEAILQTLRLLKTKYEEAKIKRDSQETDIKILELAELPRLATSTVQPVSIVLGLLIGLILGIALAFLLEYLDQSVKDPLQIERILGISLLGVVPLIETETSIIQKTNDLKKTILEPFRALRANIKHLAATYNCHTFMICSAIKGEGKTTLAANLAITFALDNKKVIIVDADLRRSQLHNLFSIQKETGLSDYLLEARTIDEIIKPTAYENLRIITSGERPHNPAELIGTMRFDVLIQELRKRADIILFDSPALLPVSDGLSMAPKMDGCIMAFRTVWTPLKAAKQAKEQISRVGAHILGGIFNGVTMGRGYYPYYYGYYGYSSYTKYSYEDEGSARKFSLRETGLKIEETFRKGARSFRNALPHHIASASSFAKALAKKRTFWVLLALFLVLSGAELWLQLRPAPEHGDEEGIVYLGVGGAGQTISNQPRSAMPAVERDTPAATHDRALQNSGETMQDSSSQSSPLRTTGLIDSVKRWFDAKKDGNVPALLQFYDSLGFRSAEGGYNELRQVALKGRKDSSLVNIAIDSVWQGFNKAPYLETMVRLRSADGADTTRVVVDMIWKQGRTGLWRIVGEKK